MLKLAAIIGILLFGASIGHADTFTYEYANSYYDLSFSFSTSSLLTRDTTIPATDLLSNNVPGLQSVEINPTFPVCGNLPFPVPGEASCLLYNATQDVGYFFSSPLTSTGIYHNGYSSLTITESTGQITPTPECSTWLFLATGITGLFIITGARPRSQESSA